jgi:hypothetical protein
MLVDTALEAETQQLGVELVVPCSWRLAKPVERLVEAQHLVLVLVVNEARGLLDVDLLLELAVQERRLDVHVVDAPAVVRSNGEH